MIITLDSNYVERSHSNKIKWQLNNKCKTFMIISYYDLGTKWFILIHPLLIVKQKVILANCYRYDTMISILSARVAQLRYRICNPAWDTALVRSTKKSLLLDVAVRIMIIANNFENNILTDY